ncbi:hypothetical protein R6Q59_034650 [Mikania micrantha]
MVFTHIIRFILICGCNNNDYFGFFVPLIEVCMMNHVYDNKLDDIYGITFFENGHVLSAFNLLTDSSTSGCSMAPANNQEIQLKNGQGYIIKFLNHFVKKCQVSSFLIYNMQIS